MKFEWNVDPEIVNLFGVLPLRYYSILFGLGLMLGLVVVQKLWIKDRWKDTDMSTLTFYVFVATFIGARLGHCLFYEFDYYSAHPLEMILPVSFENGGVTFTGFQGLASHGGIFAVFVAIYLFSRKSKLDFFSLLDKVAVGGALTAVFIRLGNFMNSEIIGKPTQADYGVVFRRVDNILRHPAQLYEAIAYLLIFIILYRIYNSESKHKGGFVFGVFFTLLFIARFTIEFFKENQVHFENDMTLNMGQMLSIPFMILGLVIMILKFRPDAIQESQHIN